MNMPEFDWQIRLFDIFQIMAREAYTFFFLVARIITPQNVHHQNMRVRQLYSHRRSLSLFDATVTTQ